MALQKALKKFIFTDGIDTRTDPMVTPISKLHRLFNGRFEKNGSITKRYGFSDAPTTVLNPTNTSTLPAVKKIAKRSQELIAYTSTPGYNICNAPLSTFSYNASTGWIEKGGGGQYGLETLDTGPSFLDRFHVSDSDAFGNIVCTVHDGATDPSYGSLFCKVEIYDVQRNIMIFETFLYNMSYPKVIAHQANTNYLHTVFWIFGVFGTNIVFYEIDTSNYTVTGPTNLAGIPNINNITNQSAFDMIQDSSGNLYFACITLTTLLIGLAKFTNPYSGPTNTYTSADTTISNPVLAVGDTTGVIYLAYTKNTSPFNLYFQTFSTALASTAGPTIAIAGIATGFGVSIGSNERLYGGDYYIPVLGTFYPSGTSAGRYGQVYYTEVSKTGGAAAISPLLGYATIMSKVFYNPSGGKENFVLATINNNTSDASYRDVYAVINLTRYLTSSGPAQSHSGTNFIAAKWYLSECGLINNRGQGVHMSHVPVALISNNQTVNSIYTATIPCRQLQQLALGASGNNLFFRGKVAKFYMDDPRALQSANISDSLLLTGGNVQEFTGDMTCENNMLYPPWVFSVTAGAGSTLTPSSNYIYCAIFEYINKAGKITFSSVSNQFAITTGSSNLTYTSRVTSYFNSNKIRQGVRIKLYRTIANGSIFYLVQVFNIPGIDIDLLITDNITDANIQLNPTLYASSGELENYNPEGCYALTTWNDRMWALADGGLFFSKTLTIDTPVEFSQFQVIDFELTSGKPTAISSLNDKLLQFKKNAVYYCTGDGPNALGQGDSFSTPQVLSSRHGAINQVGVVSLGEQVIFHSEDGFWRLKNNLIFDFIGSGVDYFAKGGVPQILANAILERDTEVRFCDGTYIYIYDYASEAWSVFTGLTPNDMVSFDSNQFAVLSGTRVLLQGTVNKYDIINSTNTNYTMSVTTGWISFDEFQQFGRLYRIYILGRYLGPHHMVVKLEYDYTDYVSETITIDSAAYIDFGGQSDAQQFALSATSNTSTAYMPLEYRIKPARQKCTSIRVTIEDVPPVTFGTSNDTFDLVGLTFEYGQKNTGNKIRSEAPTQAFVP